jgi:hypothetical protein
MLHALLCYIGAEAREEGEAEASIGAELELEQDLDS